MEAESTIDYWEKAGRTAGLNREPRANNPHLRPSDGSEEAIHHTLRAAWWRGWDKAQAELRRDSAMDARARRAAIRCGYVARRSRWRRDTPDNHGGFMIVDPSTNFPAAGFRYDLSAEAVIAWAKEE